MVPYGSKKYKNNNMDLDLKDGRVVKCFEMTYLQNIITSLSHSLSFTHALSPSLAHSNSIYPSKLYLSFSL